MNIAKSKLALRYAIMEKVSVEISLSLSLFLFLFAPSHFSSEKYAQCMYFSQWYK